MKRPVIAFLLFLISFGCGRRDEKGPAVERIFEIDPGLVENTVTLPSLGLLLQPPAGWKPAAEDMFIRYREHAGRNTEPGSLISVEPVRLFYKQESQCLLSISHIVSRNGGLTANRIASLIQKYNKIDQGDRQIIRNRYINNDILVEELHIHDKLRDALKLIFQNGRSQWIMIDYTCPESEAVKEKKAIESSIGSIRVE
ncbi:hypothetical protein JW948_18345 [bacterium]|nr:hypothetical protein [bacterium]